MNKISFFRFPIHIKKYLFLTLIIATLSLIQYKAYNNDSYYPTTDSWYNIYPVYSMLYFNSIDIRPLYETKLLPEERNHSVFYETEHNRYFSKTGPLPALIYYPLFKYFSNTNTPLKQILHKHEVIEGIGKSSAIVLVILSSILIFIASLELFHNIIISCIIWTVYSLCLPRLFLLLPLVKVREKRF